MSLRDRVAKLEAKTKPKSGDRLSPGQNAAMLTLCNTYGAALAAVAMRELDDAMTDDDRALLEEADAAAPAFNSRGGAIEYGRILLKLFFEVGYDEAEVLREAKQMLRRIEMQKNPEQMAAALGSITGRKS